MSSVVETHTDIVPRLEAAAERVQRAHKAAASVIFGQDDVIERTLVTILSGGHALLIGVPGLAKTLLVDTLGKVLGLDAKRIQFTPDLMPSDIIGSEVLEDEPGRGALVPFHQGTDLHAAADGRRNQPRLAEDAVGVAAGDAGASRHGRRTAPRHAGAVPRARDAEPARAGGHLSAARSPARPLPACRSTSAIPISSPSAECCYATTGTETPKLEAVLSAQELMAIQRLVRQIPVPDKVVEAILKLVRSARPGTGAERRDRPLRRLGSGPARQPGA